MATKALLRRMKEEKKISKKLVVPKEQEQMEKCPVFKVHYLGKIPARGEYGREFIDEPVETLLKLKDRHSKLPKTVLQITERGFHFLDVNGPFGKEKHVLIPIHHVCYGVADVQNPQVFAMITRTDPNPENSLLECHAFLCDRRKVASQITYWLLRTFLHVFEDLQRRRRERQVRKLRRQADAMDNAAGLPSREMGGLQDIPPSSPTETIAPDIYSITLEGSKENGVVKAVSLIRNKPPSTGKKLGPQGDHSTGSPRSGGGKKFATVPAMRIGANDVPSGGGARWRQPVQQMHNSHESLNYHPPLKASASAGPPVAPRRSQVGDINSSRPHSFNEGRPKIDPQNDTRAVPQPLVVNGLTNPNAPLHHQQQERARYMKNPSATRASPAKRPASHTGNRLLSSTGTSPSSSSSSAGSTVRRRSVRQEETDFIFIQMLQEEFSVFDGGSSDSNSTIRRVTGPYASNDRQLPPGAVPETNAVAAPPLDQRLSSQDIEKRIREWLKRTSPDAENISFDDSGLDRISLAGTLANHGSQRTAAADSSQFVPSSRPPVSRIDRRSVAGTFNHMPSDREYF